MCIVLENPTASTYSSFVKLPISANPSAQFSYQTLNKKQSHFPYFQFLF